jgi:hypothetical protein
MDEALPLFQTTLSAYRNSYLLSFNGAGCDALLGDKKKQSIEG